MNNLLSIVAFGVLLLGNSCSVDLAKFVDLEYPALAPTPLLNGDSVSVVTSNTLPEPMQLVGNYWLLGTEDLGPLIETLEFRSYDNPNRWIALALSSELGAVGRNAPILLSPPSHGIGVEPKILVMRFSVGGAPVNPISFSEMTVLFSVYQNGILFASFEVNGRANGETESISLSACLQMVFSQALPVLNEYLEVIP